MKAENPLICNVFTSVTILLCTQYMQTTRISDNLQLYYYLINTQTTPTPLSLIGTQKHRVSHVRQSNS